MNLLNIKSAIASTVMAFVLILLSALVSMPVLAVEVGQSFNTKASYYGGYHHGRRTASGEISNMYAMTAAHKTLPLHTVVEVTNLSNGKTARFKINDRGPYVAGRGLDLSTKGAEVLGFKHSGVANVSYTIVSLPSGPFRYIHHPNGIKKTTKPKSKLKAKSKSTKYSKKPKYTKKYTKSKKTKYAKGKKK